MISVFCAILANCAGCHHLGKAGEPAKSKADVTESKIRVDMKSRALRLGVDRIDGHLRRHVQGIADAATAVTASMRRRAGSRSPAAAAASRRDATNVLLVFAFSSGLNDAHASSSTDCRSLRASGSSAAIFGTCC